MLLTNMASNDHYKTALTCGLCQDILTDPKTLPCLHNYCLKCLHSLVENSKLREGYFNCPECQEECGIPLEGVGGFKASPTITFLVDAYKDSNQFQESECNTCRDTHEKQTPATSRCLDCNIRLCTTCQKWHDSFKFSQGHKVVDITGDKASDLQMALQSIKERNVFCEKHPTKPIELYCKVDKKVLCQLCYPIDHAGHTCEDIKQTAAQKMKPIGAVITQGKELVDMHQQAIQETQAYKSEIEKNTEDVTAAINNDMNALIQEIRTKYKSLTELVVKEKEANVKQVISHLGHLELYKAIIEGQVDKYCTMLEHGHPVEITGLAEQIDKKLEDWSKKPKLDFTTRMDIKFTDGKVNEDGLDFGKVYVELKVKPLCKATVKHKRTLQNGICDLTVTQACDFVTTGAGGMDNSKIYDNNYNLYKDLGKTFSQVTLLPDNNLAFSNQSNTISIYFPDGTHKQDIVCEGLLEICGIATNKSSGHLLVCERGKEKNVYQIDPTTGDTMAKCPSGMLNDPLSVTCNSKGVILVSDIGDNCVRGIDKDGNEVFCYGKKEDKDQQLCGPCGLCTDAGDYIFVTDCYNNCVHLLSPEGEFIENVLTEDDGLDGPTCVAIHDGKLLVGDVAGNLFTVTYRR